MKQIACDWMNQRRMLIVIISVIIAVMIIVPSTYVLLNSNAKQVIQKKKEPYITVSDGIANYTWNDSNFTKNIFTAPTSYFNNVSVVTTIRENNSSESTLKWGFFGWENHGKYYPRTNSMDIQLDFIILLNGSISGDLVPSNLTIIIHSNVDRIPSYTNETYGFGFNPYTGLEDNISFTSWGGYENGTLNLTNKSYNSSAYYHFGTYISAQDTWYIFHPGENYTIEFAAILNGLSKQVFCQTNLNIGAIAS